MALHHKMNTVHWPLLPSDDSTHCIKLKVTTDFCNS